MDGEGEGADRRQVCRLRDETAENPRTQGGNVQDRERLRLFDALLGEGLAIADGEAGSDNDLVRRWAVKVAAARLEYREDVEGRGAPAGQWGWT
jgi:hypothetical protein